MRTFLCNLVAHVSMRIVLLIDWLHSRFLFVHVLLYGLVRVGFASVGYFLMRLLDGKRTYLAEQIVTEGDSMKKQQLELKLLTAASQVRDHAKELGDWTEHHTQAINAIGNALLNELDWDEDHIHQYMKEIVESFDGLSYDLDG